MKRNVKVISLVMAGLLVLPIFETFSGIVEVHTHDFQYVVIQEASEEQDEVMQLECACRESAGQVTVPGSAQGRFMACVIREITNASEGETVTVDTKIFWGK